MARLKFEMFLDEWSKKERGICSKFTDGKGREFITWWSSPPSSIDHVGIEYIRGRFGSGITKYHEVFIKAQFKAQMKLFDEYEENKFRRIS